MIYWVLRNHEKGSSVGGGLTAQKRFGRECSESWCDVVGEFVGRGTKISMAGYQETGVHGQEDRRHSEWTRGELGLGLYYIFVCQIVSCEICFMTWAAEVSQVEV